MQTPLAKWSTTFVASTAVTADGYVGGVLEMPDDVIGGVFIAKITSTSGSSRTIDVSYNITPDDGTTYFPVLRHAQATTASVNRYLNVSFAPYIQAGTEGASATTGGALCVNVPFTRKFKVYCDVGGTTPVLSLIHI